MDKNLPVMAPAITQRGLRGSYLPPPTEGAPAGRDGCAQSDDGWPTASPALDHGSGGLRDPGVMGKSLGARRGSRPRQVPPEPPLSVPLTEPRTPCSSGTLAMVARDRDQLVQENLSLVQAVARKLKKQITARIDFDDLIGYGSKGLIEAADRFDPKHGVAFSTFAYYRVRGAMLDGLRTMGWYSRADYARYRAEERANEYLQNQSDRDGAAVAAAGCDAAPAASDKENALVSVAEILGGIATVHITSLEAASSVADERLPAPDTVVDTGRLGVRVRQAIKKLPDRERQLMELYYYGEKNLEEAGAVMGLSKSWACRLHARAVELLRTELADAEY